MAFLRVLKILAIIIGIAALPLIFIGIGLFISIPMFIFAFVIDRITNPKQNVANRKPTSKVVVNLVIVTAGVACYFGLYAIGAFGNIDTTGRPTTKIQIIDAAVVTVITVIVLWLVNRPKSIS